MRVDSVYRFLFSLVLIMCLGRTTVAQSESGVVVTGQVVDQTGRAAAGIVVKLIPPGEGEDGEPRHQAQEVKTAEDGTFAMELEKGLHQYGYGRTAWIVAQDGEERLGWLPQSDWSALQIRLSYDDAWYHEFDSPIVLQKIAPWRARIIQEDGSPLRGAEVRPVYLLGRHVSEIDPTKFYEAEPYFLPLPWQEQLASRTDDEGWFSIDGLPTRGALGVTVNDGTPLRLTAYFSDAESGLIRLPRLSENQIRFLGPVENDDLERVELQLRSQLLLIEGAALSFVASELKLRPDKSGEVNFKALPTSYSGKLDWDGAENWFATQPLSFQSKGDETNRFEIRLAKATEVTGRVILNGTEQGVGNVSLWINSSDAEATLRLSTNLITDREGRYSAYVIPGNCSIRIPDLNREFFVTRREQAIRQRPIESTDDLVKLPDLVVSRGVSVPVRVVDEDGTPVPHAVVEAEVTSNHFRLFRCNEAGDVRIPIVDPSDVVGVRATSLRGISDGTVVIEPNHDERVSTVVVSPRHASQVTGVLLDEDGTAIAKARIIATENRLSSSRFNQYGRTKTLRLGETNNDGSFKIDSLFPATSIAFEFQAEGFQTKSTKSLTIEAGNVVDLGNIQLERNVEAGVIQGIVLDEEGTPISGALVVNHGDASERSLTRTNAAGQFELQRCPPGEIALLVEKEGFAPVGAIAITEGPFTEIRLRPKFTPTTIAADSRPLNKNELQEFVRSCLEKLHTLPADERAQLNFQLAQCMVPIDPSLAVQWALEDLTKEKQLTIVCWAAQMEPQTFAEETLSLTSSSTSSSHVYLLTELAGRLKGSDHELSLRMAEEAMFIARRVLPPRRAACLSKVAKLLQELGQTEASRRLFDEAVGELDGYGNSEVEDANRSWVAASLATVDFERALSLVKTIETESARESGLEELAVLIANDNTERSLDLIKDLRDRRAVIRIAWQIVDRDASLAEQLIRTELQTSPDECHYVTALARLASEIAAEDPLHAHELIDEALAVCVYEKERFDGKMVLGFEAAAAGCVGVLASRMGYPDMESIVSRLLQCRVAEGREDESAERCESTVALAGYVALIDRKAAKWILESEEDARRFLGQDGFGKLDFSDWMISWTLADPATATRLFNEQLERELSLYGRVRANSGLIELLTCLSGVDDDTLKRLADRDLIRVPFED